MTEKLHRHTNILLLVVVAFKNLKTEPNHIFPDWPKKTHPKSCAAHFTQEVPLKLAVELLILEYNVHEQKST